MKKLIAVLFTLSLLIASCTALAATDVTIGVTGAFYEDLWQPAIDKLAEEGINLTLLQFSDFALPNNALNGGDIDMNGFQHHAYFNNDTTTNDYDLTVIADTFIITMNLYSTKYAALDDLLAAISEGKEVNIVVPNDATNLGRALLVLRDAGIIELNDEYENTPNVENIVDKEGAKVTLTPVNASMTYQYLEDVDASVINGNYAASYGVDPTSAIYCENIDATNESFINVIAVRTADKDNEVYNRVAEVFCSDITSEVAHSEFEGFFVLIWELDDAAEADTAVAAE